MGIKEYEVPCDKFGFEPGMGFDFPCVCCMHRHQGANDEPCRSCGHNVNADLHCNIAGQCSDCGGNIFHREGKPGEYDHECC